MPQQAYLSTPKVEAYISKLAANWPPLTQDTLSRVSVLVQTGGSR